MGCGASQTIDEPDKHEKNIVSRIMHEAILSSDLKFRDMEETKSNFINK